MLPLGLRPLSRIHAPRTPRLYNRAPFTPAKSGLITLEIPHRSTFIRLRGLPKFARILGPKSVQPAYFRLPVAMFR